MCAFMTPIVKQNYNLYGTKHSRNSANSSLSSHSRSRSHPGAHISGQALSTLMPPNSNTNVPIKRQISAGPLGHGSAGKPAGDQLAVTSWPGNHPDGVPSPSSSTGTAGPGGSSHPPRAANNPRNAASTSALYIKQCRDRAAAKGVGSAADGSDGENRKQDKNSSKTSAGRSEGGSMASAKSFGNSIANMIRGSNRSEKSEKLSGEHNAAAELKKASVKTPRFSTPGSESNASQITPSDNNSIDSDRNGNNNATTTHFSANNLLSYSGDSERLETDKNGNSANGGDRTGKLTLSDVRRSLSLNTSSKASCSTKRKTIDGDSSGHDILNSNLTRNWNNKAVASGGFTRSSSHQHQQGGKMNTGAAGGPSLGRHPAPAVPNADRKRESLTSESSETSAIEASNDANIENAFGGSGSGINPVRKLFARLKRSHSERQNSAD